MQRDATEKSERRGYADQPFIHIMKLMISTAIVLFFRVRSNNNSVEINQSLKG